MIKKKIKILGSGPTGSLLAINLASNNCEVELVEPLNDYELTLKDKGYAITQSSRRILEKLGLWGYIQKFAVGFNSLSLIDDELSQLVIVRVEDLKQINSNQTNIGWVIEHKYLMQILIDSINKNKSIQKKNIDSTNNNCFDFILAADGRDSDSRKKWQIKYIKQFYNQRCISFRARLRGAPLDRAYEIFRHEGPLALLPLKNNIFQVIWFSSVEGTKKKLSLSNVQILKKLKQILPDKIEPEEIVSSISNYSVAKAFALPKFCKFKNILVGDSAHSFHPVGGQGLNSCIRDIDELSNMINNYENSSIIKQKIFSIIYFFNRSIDILPLIFFTDFLIKLFSNKNRFFYPLRLLIFYMLKKIKFIRVNIFSLMTDSIKIYKFKKYK